MLSKSCKTAAMAQRKPRPGKLITTRLAATPSLNP